MKNATVFFVALALGASSVRAQGLQNVWQVVDSTLNENGPLVFTTNDSGFVGTSANLYVTTDGGHTFTARPMPSSVFPMDIKDMCWPTSQDGFLLFLSSDGSSSTLVQTADAGKTWNVYSSSSQVFYSISFPTPNVGYATGQNNPVGTGYFVVKTTNAGQSWAAVKASTLSVGPVRFKTSEAGMFVIFDGAGVPQVSYTFDGMNHIDTTKGTIAFGGLSEETSFLRWNNDGSWIVQYQGLVRSSDSGRTWQSVLPDGDGTNYGTISAACFHGNRGFAFGDNTFAFQTTDYGTTWIPFTQTIVKGTDYTTFPNESVTPALTCSMPSDTVAYMLGQNGNNIAVLRVNIPPPAFVAEPMVPAQAPLAVTVSGSFLEFTSAPEMNARTIAIYDVLGRKCAELPLGPMRMNASLSASTLQPGSYFARLGNYVTKFIVW